METALKCEVPEYCAVPMADTDETITAETEKDTVPFTAEVKSFEDKNTRLIFTLKVLLIFLLQAVEVGAIVMIVIACRDIQWGDMGHIALFYFLLMYSVTLVLMVVIHLYFKNILHTKYYNYFILVFCPTMVALVILSLLALSNAWYERYLLIMTFLSWLCYVTSAVGVLTFVYYTLHFEKKKQPENLIYIIASAMFAITYYGCIPFKVYHANDLGIIYLSGPAIFSGILLYLHYLYILYDIKAMTGSNYHLEMTPDDYIKGAVNLQSDFVFIIKDYVRNGFGLIGTMNVDSIINIFRTNDDIISTKEEVKTCTKDPGRKSGPTNGVSMTDQSSVGFYTLEPVNTSIKDDLLTLIKVCICPLALIFDNNINLFKTEYHIPTTEEKANISPEDLLSNGSADLSSNNSVPDQSSDGFLSWRIVCRQIRTTISDITTNVSDRQHTEHRSVYVTKDHLASAEEEANISLKKTQSNSSTVPSSDVTVPDELTLGDVYRQIRTVISDIIITIFGTAKNPHSNGSADPSSNDSTREQTSVGFPTDQTIDIEDDITPKYSVPKRVANSLSDVPELHRPPVRFATLCQIADIEDAKTCPKPKITGVEDNSTSNV